MRNDTRRITGPFIRGLSYTVHPRVQMFYSKGIYDWLIEREENPASESLIEDGAMIVKEMHVSNIGESPSTKQRPEDETLAGWNARSIRSCQR